MDRVSRVVKLARSVAPFVFLACLLFGLWTAAADVRLADVAAVLRRANVDLLAATIPLVFVVNFAGRAARFAAILGPRPGQTARARFWSVGVAVLLGQTANNLLPLRAGELVRTRELVRRGHAWGPVAFAQVAEKLVELASLLVWTAPVLVPYGGYRRPALVASAVVLLGLPAMLWLARRLRLPIAGSAVGDDRRRRTALLRAFGFSLVSDAAEIAVIALCLESLGLPARLGACILIFVGVNLAIALPAAPANLGALEAGAALTLVALGMPREAALGFALLYHLVQWTSVTLGGGLVWLGRAYARVAHSHQRAPLSGAPWVMP